MKVLTAMIAVLIALAVSVSVYWAAVAALVLVGARAVVLSVRWLRLRFARRATRS